LEPKYEPMAESGAEIPNQRTMMKNMVPDRVEMSQEYKKKSQECTNQTARRQRNPL
jgi:hypothetical protein